MIKAMWEHGYGTECIEPILDGESHEVLSVCIDKDPIAESILRLTLEAKNIVPSEDLKIHCWKTIHTDGSILHFVDDEQNELLKTKFPTACNI